MKAGKRGVLRAALLEAIREAEAKNEPWTIAGMAERFGVARGAVYHHLLRFQAEHVIVHGERLVRTPGLVVAPQTSTQAA